MMRPYFIGLQFLTRITLVRQDNWTAEDFGRSVKFFPLIGATLGVVYAFSAWFMSILLPLHGVNLPQHLTSVVLLLLPVLFTGGLHCDGFMDTMDGLFSGRSPEKMLAIMKDSRVGSNGVFAFVTLMLLEWAIILDMPNKFLVTAFFVMPIIARLMMTAVIVFYPYARPEGMGKAFKMFSDSRTMYFATITAALFILPFGTYPVLATIVAALFAASFARFAVNKVGGLTGDIYGAVCTISEALVLLSFLLAAQIS